MTEPATTAVLLCTYNGAAHLAAQLESLRAQSARGVIVYASDDGSTDGTVDLLHAYVQSGVIANPPRQGPGRDHTANFLSLVCDRSIEARYYAYADQDDQWDSDKVERAVASLASIPDAVPALYCGRTRSVTADGDPLGLSPLFGRKPSFQNALVHNIAGGNTMVFNAAARDLLNQAGMVNVVCHDWWTYLLISGAGGRVVYDPEPSLSYRQHDKNEIGANLGWGDRAWRYFKALGGRNREWVDRNLRALQDNSHLLTPANRELLDQFSRSRRGRLSERLSGLRQSGLYAQTASGNIGLYVATLLKKI